MKRFQNLEMDGVEAPSRGDKLRRRDPVPTMGERERSVSDLKLDSIAATKAGFDLEEPIFEIGTPVNSLGVANARASRLEWEDMATVTEALEQIQSGVRSQDRESFLCTSSELSIDKSTCRVSTPDGSFLMNEEATKGLASRLGMGPSSGGFLTNGVTNSSARAWLFNQALLRDTEMFTKDGTDLQFRTWKIGEERTAFATLSHVYTPFDGDLVAEAMADGLSAAGISGARCRADVQGARGMFDVMFHSDLKAEEYSAGEIFKAGLRLRFADDGTGSINVSSYLQRNLCKNLIITDESSVSAKVRHTGGREAVAEKVAQAIAQSQDRLGYFLEKWGHAQQDVVDLDAAEGRSPEQVVEAVLSGLAERGVIGKRQIGEVQEHFFAYDADATALQGVVSRAGVANAISRFAGTQDRWSADALEKASGGLAWGKTPINRYVEVSVLR